MIRKHRVDQLLGGIPLFAACSATELAHLSRLCTPVAVPAGRVLTREGDIGHEFFVVARGQATVSVDGDVVAVLGAGDFFGEIALLDGGARTATVTAETDLLVEVISHQEFFTVLVEVPSVTRRILRNLGARLRAADAALAVC